jgi:uroporphyrinogen decarboxylase
MTVTTSEFTPDYRIVVNAARNKPAARLPLYEHIISDEVMEQILGEKFASLAGGDAKDKAEYFSHYCRFFKTMGYDTVSYECCLGQVMPDSGCLGQHKESVIHDYGDFEKYPWDRVPDLYFETFTPYFEALEAAMPPGMKAVGGVGNGVFECVQDIIGYMNLCYISSDDPDLYAVLFQKMGDTILAVWKRFLERWGDLYCVPRFGDDLGFKNGPLLSPEDIRSHIIPQYKRIIETIHGYGKPFLLHSCGAIFEVMPDLIRVAGIDAKHSNEDQIAVFPVWVEKYGGLIGNFGGMDTDALCRLPPPEIRDYVKTVLAACGKPGGLAFGTGNSVPNYVPPENYLEMVRAVREWRGEK